MNKIDKEWYKALNFLSRMTLDESFEFKKKYPEKFNKYVPEIVWNNLHIIGHITSSNNTSQTVTNSGLQQLRELADIRRKDLTLIASVIAVCISMIALTKSFGWL